MISGEIDLPLNNLLDETHNEYNNVDDNSLISHNNNNNNNNKRTFDSLDSIEDPQFNGNNHITVNQSSIRNTISNTNNNNNTTNNKRLKHETIDILEETKNNTYSNNVSKEITSNSLSFIQNQKLLKCFSSLRNNYLSLCSSYNELVDKLESVEQENQILIEQSKLNNGNEEQWKIEKERFMLEREDMKSMLDALLHEVTILRRKTKN